MGNLLAMKWRIFFVYNLFKDFPFLYYSEFCMFLFSKTAAKQTASKAINCVLIGGQASSKCGKFPLAIEGNFDCCETFLS
jgi:hypothetical protein